MTTVYANSTPSPKSTIIPIWIFCCRKPGVIKKYAIKMTKIHCAKLCFFHTLFVYHLVHQRCFDPSPRRSLYANAALSLSLSVYALWPINFNGCGQKRLCLLVLLLLIIIIIWSNTQKHTQTTLIKYHNMTMAGIVHRLCCCVENSLRYIHLMNSF